MINANFNKRKRSIFLKLENRSYAQQFTVNCKPNCTVRTIKLMRTKKIPSEHFCQFNVIVSVDFNTLSTPKQWYNLCHRIEKPFKRGERWCVHYWFLATNFYIHFIHSLNATLLLSKGENFISIFHLDYFNFLLNVRFLYRPTHSFIRFSCAFCIFDAKLKHFFRSFLSHL